MMCANRGDILLVEASTLNGVLWLFVGLLGSVNVVDAEDLLASGLWAEQRPHFSLWDHRKETPGTTIEHRAPILLPL